MTTSLYPSRSYVEPQKWYVQSHSTPGLTYEVWPFVGPGGSCTCPDFQHRGGPCKHIRQVRAEAEALSELVDAGLTVADDGRQAEPTAAEVERERQRANAALYRELFPVEV